MTTLYPRAKAAKETKELVLDVILKVQGMLATKMYHLHSQCLLSLQHTCSHRERQIHCISVFMGYDKSWYFLCSATEEGKHAIWIFKKKCKRKENINLKVRWSTMHNDATTVTLQSHINPCLLGHSLLLFCHVLTFMSHIDVHHLKLQN